MDRKTNKYADLHVHTFYSDSTFSPEEVINCAADKGISCIAICDHDCVDGIEPCVRAGNKKGIEVIPGVELTVEKDNNEIHILGYFIEWREKWLKDKLKVIQEGRIARMKKMIEKLKEIDIHVDINRVFEISGRGSVGRLHLAYAMVEAGAVKNLQGAFRKYIGHLKPCYVKNINFSPREAIEVILKARGVPVLSHPHITGKDEFIPEFVKYGLKGIEAYHTDHNSGVKIKYEKIAGDLGLIITGGSDCHGMGKGRVLMGGVKVPYGLVERLKEEARRIRTLHR